MNFGIALSASRISFCDAKIYYGANNTKSGLNKGDFGNIKSDLTFGMVASVLPTFALLSSVFRRHNSSIAHTRSLSYPRSGLLKRETCNGLTCSLWGKFVCGEITRYNFNININRISTNNMRTKIILFFAIGITTLLVANFALAQEQTPPRDATFPPPTESGGAVPQNYLPPSDGNQYGQSPQNNFYDPRAPQGEQSPSTPQDKRMDYRQNDFPNQPPQPQGEGDFRPSGEPNEFRPFNNNPDGQERGEGGFRDNEREGGNGDKFREEQEKRDLERMKKDIKRMAGEITSLERRIKNLSGKGLNIPSEIKETLSEAREIIAKVQNASSFEEIQDAGMEEIGDLMRTVYEELNPLERASELPKMFKNVERELTNQFKILAKAENKLKKLKIDLSQLVAEWRQKLEEIRGIRDKAKGDFEVGNYEEAAELLNRDFWDNFEDIREKAMTFEMVSNTNRMLKSAEKEIKSSEKMIAKLKKQGKNTNRLNEIIAQGRAGLAEIKSFIGSGLSIDPDELMEKIQSMENTRNEFEAEWEKITGNNENITPIKLQNSKAGERTSLWQAPSPASLVAAIVWSGVFGY